LRGNQIHPNVHGDNAEYPSQAKGMGFSTAGDKPKSDAGA
jgi:hypothetical protein